MRCGGRSGKVAPPADEHILKCLDDDGEVIGFPIHEMSTFKEPEAVEFELMSEAPTDHVSNITVRETAARLGVPERRVRKRADRLAELEAALRLNGPVPPLPKAQATDFTTVQAKAVVQWTGTLYVPVPRRTRGSCLWQCPVGSPWPPSSRCQPSAPASPTAPGCLKPCRRPRGDFAPSATAQLAWTWLFSRERGVDPAWSDNPLPDVAPGGWPAADDLLRGRLRRRGPQGTTRRRHGRQPVGQDDGKRGPGGATPARR